MNNAKNLDYRIPDIKYPKVKVKKTRIRYLTDEQETRLMGELSPHKQVNTANATTTQMKYYNYTLVKLLATSGMRLGEASILKWTDLSFDLSTVSVYRPKVDNNSILHIPTETIAALKELCDLYGSESEYIFPAKDGGPRKHATGAYNKAVARTLPEFDSFTIHDVRHHFASTLAMKGASFQAISMILGQTYINQPDPTVLPLNPHIHVSKNCSTND